MLQNKTQKMCDNVVPRDPYYLLGVLDSFVTSQQIKIWHDSDYHYDEDVIKWYNGYQKRVPQKSHYKTGACQKIKRDCGSNR